MSLSQQRTNVVKDYLVKRGIDSSLLFTQGFGPTRPLVKETDKASMAKNRRVEFKVDWLD